MFLHTEPGEQLSCFDVSVVPADGLLEATSEEGQTSKVFGSISLFFLLPSARV